MKGRFLCAALLIGAVCFVFTGCPVTGSPGETEFLKPPSKPRAPELFFLNNSIIAGWNGVSGAGSYEVYCSADRENPGTAVQTPEVTGAVLTGPEGSGAFIDGNDYYVWIQAKNSAGSSPLSDPAVKKAESEKLSHRDMVTVAGKTVTGSDSYKMTFTVPSSPPGYMDAGKEQTKKGVFVQGRNITIDTFKMAKYETTRKLYFAVQAWALGNGYRFAHTVRVFSNDNKDNPVSGISWRDAIVWCNAYSEMMNLQPVYRDSDDEVLRDSTNAAVCDNAKMCKDKSGYRLPTEVEREFAARGGDPDETDWMYLYAGNKDNADAVAWYHGNSAYAVQEVGRKTENRLGIHDLSGNVQEWCWDWMNYAVDVTPATPDDGAAYSGTAPFNNQKAFNGGGVGSNVTYSCVAYRWGYSPEYTSSYVGFRVVRKP